MEQQHLGACPWLITGIQGDCSCDKEVAHYLKLATWSFGLFLFEFLGGLISGSVALISDSFHVLLDGTENIVSAIVSKLARKYAHEKKLRSIGGKISASLLFIAGVSIVHEGYERVIAPHRVEWYMTIIAIIGLSVNLWQLRLHHRAHKEHYNETHFWQNWHLISDAAASVAVVVGGGIMLILNDWYWIDGILSIGIGTLITILVSAKFFGVHLHHHSTHNHCHHNKND